MSARIPNPLNHERRRLVSLLTDQARKAWQMGRSDRVAGYEPAIKWRDDPYYMAGYTRERRKEVATGVQVAA